MEGKDYLRRQTDRIKERDLSLTAWVVYAYDHYLARKYPECAKQDALGNRYLSQLSVSHPDVRAYFLALTEDLIEHCRPDTVLLESLSFRAFEYGLMNPKVNVAITPWCRFLLGLCMSDQSIGAATKAGMDGVAFRDEVASYLREQLTRIPSEREMQEPVTEEKIETAFDGRLAQFTHSRYEVASSLLLEVIDKVKSFGDIEIAVYPGFPNGLPNPVTGLSPQRIAGLVDYEYVAPEPDAVAMQAKATDSQLLLNTQPTKYSSAAELKSTVGECLENGADGVSIYGYGLVQIEHLRWVGEMRSIWEAE